MSSVSSSPLSLSPARAARRAVVGFSGSRSLSPSFAPLVSRVVASVLAAGRLVVVGDCSGADALVRAAAGRRCAVARVSPSSRVRLGRGAFAARSVRLVRSVARRRFWAGSGFVGFVSAPCPSGVVPSRSWSSGASASGSWSSLALAAGWGLPVFVFWCAPGAPVLPAWPGGSWVPGAPSGVWAGSWRWVAAGAQPPLFEESSPPLLDDVVIQDYPLRIIYYRRQNGMRFVRDTFQDTRHALELRDSMRCDPDLFEIDLQVHCPAHGWTQADEGGYCPACLDELD